MGAPYHTNICKIVQLCGAMALSLDILPLNLVGFVI